MRAELPLMPTTITATVPNVIHGEPSFTFYPVSMVLNSEAAKNLICQQDSEHSPHLLNNPIQLPCGHRFCKVTCWEPNLYLQQQLCRRPEAICPVPGCQSVFTVEKVFLDKHTVREANSLAVHCLNRANGCQWDGDLASLKKDHIHRCTFVKVPRVKHDSADSQELVTMLSKLAIRQDNAQNQMHSCHCLIRQCQEQIRLLIKSSGVTEGDMTKFEDFESRVTNAVQHLSSQLTHIKHNLEGVEEQMAEFAGCIPRLEKLEKLAMVSRPVETCQDGIYLWKIGNFNQLFTRSESTLKVCYSPPFYLERYGYKMCVRMYVYDKVESDKDWALGISIPILRGDYDNILKWPFKKNIVMILLDQSPMQDHYDLTFHCGLTPDCYQKPTNDRHPEYEIKLISHRKLRESYSGQSKYVSSDGQLFLKFATQNSELT